MAQLKYSVIGIVSPKDYVIADMLRQITGVKVCSFSEAFGTPEDLDKAPKKPHPMIVTGLTESKDVSFLRSIGGFIINASDNGKKSLNPDKEDTLLELNDSQNDHEVYALSSYIYNNFLVEGV